MANYVYPAIFTKEDGGYSIRFPDFESCYTSAQTIQEGMDMANDVLCLTLYGMEEDGKPIPAPSDIQAIPVAANEFTTLVTCDTMEYRKFYDNQAVKKTLTIPAWLDRQAKAADLNFSQVLQEGLTQRLNIGMIPVAHGKRARGRVRSSAKGSATAKVRKSVQ